MIYLFVICILLMGLIIFQTLSHHEEKKELLNRIMSRNYNEYKMLEGKPKDDLETISPLTEEQEAILEQTRSR